MQPLSCVTCCNPCMSARTDGQLLQHTANVCILHPPRHHLRFDRRPGNASSTHLCSTRSFACRAWCAFFLVWRPLFVIRLNVKMAMALDHASCFVHAVVKAGAATRSKSLVRFKQHSLRLTHLATASGFFPCVFYLSFLTSLQTKGGARVASVHHLQRTF
jgi:hypothetical protein